MTRDEWLTSVDPAAMLHVMASGIDRAGTRIGSDRKLRLFACAACRVVWHLLTDGGRCGRCGGSGKVGMSSHGENCSECGGTGGVNRSRRAVEVAERYADGEATEQERRRAEQSLDRPDLLAGYAAWPAALYGAQRIVALADTSQRAAQAALLRDIAGDPWQPVTLSVPCRYCRATTTDGRRVPGLSGCGDCGAGPDDAWHIARRIYAERDFAALPVLRDALIDAGCDSGPLLAHLATAEGHVRGCWALDLLLGKS